MNAKIIEGLKAIREGIDLILEEAEAVTPVSKQKEEKKSEAVVTQNAPKKEENSANVNTVTREQLDGMTYNNIKKLAKEMGISAVGNREEITAKILGETVEAEDETPAEVVEPEEVEVDNTDVDPLYAKVVDSVSDMSNEDIADILADIGMSAKGKREALIEKLVQAVREGLLDFDDEDEDTEEVAEEVSSKEEVASVESDEEDDLTNDIDNPNMTEARKKAIISQDEEIREQFDNGDVSREDLVEFLQSFYDTEDDMSDMSDEDLLDTYIDAVCRLIDDDGELIDEGAYNLNGEPACCGRVLSYSADTNVFICEHCGEEYEAE